MHDHKPITSYVKNEKGKYVPIGHYEDIDYWRRGTYLVHIQPGSTSIRSKLYMDRAAAEVEAVIDRLGDKLIDRLAVLHAEPDRPRNSKITPKQRKAYEMWMDAFKTDVVWYKSRHDIVEEVMNMVREEIKKENKHEQG